MATVPLQLCLPQLLLDLADSMSTKGTKSGTFVMYNCARLATLFEGYQRGVDQGLYPTFPPVSSLDFSLLREEVSALPGVAPWGGLDSPFQQPFSHRVSGCCSSTASSPSPTC